MPIPVVRADAFYTPPRSLPPDAWADVPAAELVFRWYSLRMQRTVEPPAGEFVIGETYYARINQNRWLTDCICASAQVISPADQRYACTECGYGWINVVWPDDYQAAEASVMAQVPFRRNWWNPDDPRNPVNVQGLAP